MGLEDYGVILKPRTPKSMFPNDNTNADGGASSAGSRRRPLVRDVVALLETVGFTRLPQTVQVGAARLAAAPESEFRLTGRHEIPGFGRGSGPYGEYIVEALVRGREDGRTHELVFESLSMRFAVCQPEGAAWHFLKLVKRLCDTLSLVIVHGEKTYSPEIFWAFRLRANEQIRTQQALWKDLFDDSERLPIAVEDTWGHFLKKHPGLKDSRERTILPRTSARQRCADIDVEATLPPKLAKTVPARRGTRS